MDLVGNVDDNMKPEIIKLKNYTLREQLRFLFSIISKKAAA